MANNVIGLFENRSVADRVVQELLAAGFSERNLNRYEGSQDEIERELGREGISSADADYYAEGLRSGGALVSVRAKDNQVDEAVEIMNRYANTGTADDSTTYDTGTVNYAASAPSDLDTAAMGTTTEVTEVSTPVSAATPMAATTDADEARLAVAEERLTVGKREVQRGGMRVRRVITEMPVEEQVTLRDETIRVDRRPVDRAVSGTDDLFSEQTFEFTETDEEAVIAKEARVIEEVVVGKTVEQRTETVRDTVRRSDVQIEEIAATYGQTLASDVRYSERTFDDIETEARSSYERDNAGGEPWESVRDSVRSSYESSRNRR